MRAGDLASDVLYREIGLWDEVVEGGLKPERQQARFDKFWHAAATGEDTIDFMRNRIKELEAQFRGRPVA